MRSIRERNIHISVIPDVLISFVSAFLWNKYDGDDDKQKEQEVFFSLLFAHILKAKIGSFHFFFFLAKLVALW